MPAAKKPKLTCFFITPIGKSGSAERKRADDIKRYILNETLAGKYKVIRADELQHPGSVSHQIISLLYTADLVIADLTRLNANVVYELAIRHAFNKVSIHLVDKAQEIPFDLKDERTIIFDLGDLESVEECKADINKVVQVIGRGKVQYSSPIYRALGLAAATAEEREAFIDTIAEQIESIATDVSSIETTLTMSDIDDLDGIGKNVTAIEKGQFELAKDVNDLKYNVQKNTRQIGLTRNHPEYVLNSPYRTPRVYTP
jgi:acetolactate synthase small subunit